MKLILGTTAVVGLAGMLPGVGLSDAQAQSSSELCGLLDSLASGIVDQNGAIVTCAMNYSPGANTQTVANGHIYEPYFANRWVTGAEVVSYSQFEYGGYYCETSGWYTSSGYAESLQCTTTYRSPPYWTDGWYGCC